MENTNGKLVHPTELGKKTFEVKMFVEDGAVKKAVFIDNIMLDYEVDVSSLAEAIKMGPQFYKAVQRDIEKHFVACVSEMVGRKVTAEEIKEATKTGWI